MFKLKNVPVFPKKAFIDYRLRLCYNSPDKTGTTENQII